MKNKIVINGKKLNSIQSYMFNKSESTIDATITSILLFGMVFSAFAMIISPLLNSLLLFIISLIIFVSGWVFIDKMSKKIVVGDMYLFAGDYDEFKALINGAWIMNEEALRKLLTTPWMVNGEQLREFLKETYGNGVFTDLKMKELTRDKTMISHIENPSKSIVEDFIKNKYRPNKNYRFKSFSFSKFEDIEKLRNFYIKVKGLNIKDAFQKRALGVKTKEDLIKELDEVLVW